MHERLINQDFVVQKLVAMYGAASAAPAELLCDQHPATSIAYRVVDDKGAVEVLTFGELRAKSEAVAAGMAQLGIEPGDRVATLMGKSVEHLITLMAIWRLGAVQVPLFTAFAPAAIAMRLGASEAKLVICSADQAHKLELGPGVLANPPCHVVVAGGDPTTGKLAFSDLYVDDEISPARGGADAPLILMYTSGTTGKPKGVVVPTKALAGFHAYMLFGLDLRADDVFWNAADPAWGYGLYCGVLGTFATGVQSVWLQGGFTAETTARVLVEQGVTNFAAAPTVYRSLRAADIDFPKLALRCASSGGEPLTPEVNEWAEDALGVCVADHYGQTETGMLIHNHHHPDLRRPMKPGSMGHPMPGWTARVLDLVDDVEVPANTLGRIAINLAESPLAWFDGYLHEPGKTAEKSSADGRWYLTGDTGRIDEDGYFHFLSRDDDVIIMAGYRIGPFDVESVLATHPSVAEVAVIAAPDEIRGEVLEAHVVLANSWSGSDQLAAELQQLVKTQYAAHAHPRRVHFVDGLPKTPSGKIQRYVLRRQAEERIVNG